MLFLVGNVGEPIGYVFCVFPLVEFCLRPDFRVYTVENLLADFTAFAFCGINKAADATADPSFGVAVRLQCSTRNIRSINYM